MIKFIADIGSNHNGDLNRLTDLIYIAKNVGCWGIKVQLFQLDKLLHKPSFTDDILHRVKMSQLPREWLPEIKNKCEIVDINFGATPFDMEAVKQMRPYVDFVKISSFDIDRKDLIEEAAKLNKPIFISTGMIKRAQQLIGIKNLLKIVNEKHCFLHCVSKYPTKLEECYLENIFRIAQYVSFNHIGYSDHTTNEIAIYEAINYGARVIEFHLDIGDDKGYENGFGHCWKPKDIERVIKNVNAIDSIRRECWPTDEELNQRADMNDGLRPMKEAR
ncbi:MAG: N-acetylneuraminate synthase family protein [Promethearchaeota archaeon]|jgi:N-acetylneuraminate synthase